MKLQHSTQVQAAPGKVWEFLQDTRAVVACLPGAELTDDKGNDQYGGVLRVSIGPLKLNYNGQVDVTRRDADARTLELSAAARDRRGGGSVRADVRVMVVDAGDGTSKLESTTDLQLTGRIAALGRGVQDVSNSMFADFSRRLAERVTGTGQAPAAQAAPQTTQSAPAPQGTASAPQAVATDTQAPVAAPTAGGEIKLSSLVLSVTRERLSALFLRWSEKLRP